MTQGELTMNYWKESIDENTIYPFRIIPLMYRTKEIK